VPGSRLLSSGPLVVLFFSTFVIVKGYEVLAHVAGRLVAQYGITVTNITLSSSEPAKTADAIARIAAQGLRDAAARLGDVTPAQVYALCVQAWERQQAAAIAAGQTLNAQPCGGSSAVVTAPTR
jgi:hypothetical protein